MPITAEYAMSKSPFDLSVISLNLIVVNHPFFIKSFCFLKITSFHTSHNNFKILPLPSKLQREKMTRKVVSNTRSIVVFPTSFPPFLSRFLSERTMQRHISGFSRQTKGLFTRTWGTLGRVR